jgi:hypothetical protein
MFPKAELLLHLHELEQQFLKLGLGVMEESKFSHGDFHAREMGRAHGFFVAAHLISDEINKICR